MISQTINVTTTRYNSKQEQVDQTHTSMRTMGAGSSEQVAAMMFEIMDHTQDISIQGPEILVREPNGDAVYFVYSVTNN